MRLGYRTGYRPAGRRSHQSNGRRPRHASSTILGRRSSAEIAFSDKDAVGIGTTNTITPAVATQFQTVASFFASEGVSKAVTVHPYVIQPGGAG